MTNRSPFSKSLPIIDKSRKRCLVPKHSQADLITEKAAQRAGARLIVAADISRFYHSIYTHSIPWAMHGKDVAKRERRDRNLIGNRLDRAFQAASGGQTIGIPIGPDASLAVAEVVLSAVDMSLAGRLDGSRVLRYIDDYEIVCESHDQAEEALAFLQHALAEYELELSPLKSRIESLPVRHESSWVSFIRRQGVRVKGTGQANDLIVLFDRAFEEARLQPESPVLRYLMGRLRSVAVTIENWPLLQSLLLQCMTHEPATLQGAMSVVLRYLEQGYSIDRENFSSTLNSIIQRHAPLAHGNEVLWALWSLLTLDLQICADAVRKIQVLSDPFVALLAMHGERLGRLARISHAE